MDRTEEFLNELEEKTKLLKEAGCNMLECNVIKKNINLRLEIIQLKKKIRELEKEKENG